VCGERERSRLIFIMGYGGQGETDLGAGRTLTYQGQKLVLNVRFQLTRPSPHEEMKVGSGLKLPV
jgi:hypothetical protein